MTPSNTSPSGEKLTKAQRRLLGDLSEAPFDWAACEGAHDKRTAKALQQRGLVQINDELSPWFDCRLTPAGRAALSTKENERGR